MARNKERVLSDALITDIKAELFNELGWTSGREEFIDALMNAYLTGDWESFKQFATETIEGYEDDIITFINTQLMEESYKNDQPEFYD